MQNAIKAIAAHAVSAGAGGTFYQNFRMGATVAIALAVTACGGGNPEETPPVAVYKSLGALTCTGGGLGLPAVVKQLSDAGVTPLASSCGNDGLARPAVCGVPDGRIAIIDVAAAQTGAAKALGFAPLSELPMAVKTACS
jgi:hypothetical protein